MDEEYGGPPAMVCQLGADLEEYLLETAGHITFG